ncbi:hypothetical protein GCM10011581_06090 [Saccharopolyspora subtropica]|uniref:Pycsar effector protein domain-containing protein n=1 Tax=Saccharopolyspora thermophila TaxID=89367 RepID=A0A917N736_9PSEU|nr:Pycsar system effector family protein [Saccharopolyspora subtropica]GGI71884.1 hypothetical protein GCM10011581_06090 [Saccharopolyspora subtropica]
MTSSDDAWKAIQHTNDLIKVADTKAGAMLAASGVLGGMLVRALPAQNRWLVEWPHVGLLLLSTAAVSASILLSLRVFIPRLRTDTSRSLLYFDNVARRYARAADFVPVYRAALEDPQRLEAALAEQLWATSRIARRKFRSVALAIWLFGAALVIALAAGLAKP